MKPFLILQLRPEDEAADEEYASILRRGRLRADQTRRIRLDRDSLPATLILHDYAGLIVGGGPGCVSDPPTQKTPTEARIEAAILSLMPQVIAADFPFLGCCYGIGILGRALNAPVGKSRYGEAVGAVTVRQTPQAATEPLLNGLPQQFTALVGHKEALEHLPADTAHLLAGDACPFQMIRHRQNIYATQFHPESDGNSFALRIRIYRNKGYFPPDTADALTAAIAEAQTETSGQILANFTTRYA
ncbi:MAG: glutamine amidotransferase [Paracoccus sp. (in: a-proteobacteria)]|uniref:glutamine amidotransferase n=1 Tax=Paracoccus sp. TaxID=267 RepID=UPI0026E038EB|nr:glutamine amidotransferase [Paracoccus sp. (in: a-proteobacteria)]MDO5612788.1 glutamine amidotransferase [Paracoccus sp. (in: a-proteobacteria)]